MSYFDLNTISPAELQQQLTQHHTIVACLCAAWCDVCIAYRSPFEALAQEHLEHLFLWIDVEDQSEVVGNFEVENFPTLLIQQQGVVTFYGTMQPDTKQLERLLRSQADQSLGQLHTIAHGQQRLWQKEADLLGQLKQQLKLLLP